MEMLDIAWKENLFKYFELDSLPVERQEKTLVELNTIIWQAVLIKVVDRLSEKELDEFEQLLDTIPPDGNVIRAFMQSRIPDLQKIMVEEVILLKTQLEHPLKSRYGVEETPAEMGLSEAMGLGKDVASPAVGTTGGPILNLITLFVGLSYDPRASQTNAVRKTDMASQEDCWLDC